MGRKGNIPKGNNFLVKYSIENLVQRYRKEKNAKTKLRLLAFIHRKDGKTEQAIAELLYQPIMTIHDWLLKGHIHGIDKIEDKKQSGRPKRMKKKQLEQLDKLLSNPPTEVRIPSVIWSAKLVRYYIAHTFHINYKLPQIRRILSSLNFTAQKARPRHKKANKELQEEFKKTLDQELMSILKMDSRSFHWTRQSFN